jgi:hypothetical protein
MIQKDPLELSDELQQHLAALVRRQSFWDRRRLKLRVSSVSTYETDSAG